MSRSRKDGKRGGGHRNTQSREVWSKRCRGVAMWARDTFGWKRITHRFERRAARMGIRQHDSEAADLLSSSSGQGAAE